MEREYWLARKRYHAASAQAAATSDVRLIHLDLAGRYSVKAAAGAAGRVQGVLRSVPMLQAETRAADLTYDQLEIGARWLASRAGDLAERQVHLGMANRYARLRLETIPTDRH